MQKPNHRLQGSGSPKFKKLPIVMTALASLATALINISCTHFGKEPKGQTNVYRLDHVPIAVRDLRSATARYGSQFGVAMATGPEREGLQTAVGQFQDGSYLELAQATGAATAPGGGHPSERPAQLLRSREGASYIGISVSSLAGVKSRFESAKIPFEERDVTDRSGKVLFKALWPAGQNALNIAVFIERPTDATSSAPPLANQHKSTAEGLHEIWVVADDVDALLRDLAAVGLDQTDDVILQPLRVHARRVRLEGGQLIVVKREHLEEPAKKILTGSGTEIIGVSVRITDLDAASKLLKKSRGLKFAIARYNEKSSLIIDPKFAHGLLFELTRPPSYLASPY